MAEFEKPQAELIEGAPVYNAKSWNPGKGNDTTGTESDNAQHNGTDDKDASNNGNRK